MSHFIVMVGDNIVFETTDLKKAQDMYDLEKPKGKPRPSQKKSIISINKRRLNGKINF